VERLIETVTGNQGTRPAPKYCLSIQSTLL
jgi:hypothetical protein